MNIEVQKFFYALMRIILESISKFIYFLMYFGSESEVLPSIKNLTLLEPASVLALKIRTKKVCIQSL